MKTQRETIKNLLEERPELWQRKFRYVVISNLTGVDPETCKLICSVADDYRHITQVDEVRQTLAEEWKSPMQKKYEAEEKQILKQKLF